MKIIVAALPESMCLCLYVLCFTWLRDKFPPRGQSSWSWSGLDLIGYIPLTFALKIIDFLNLDTFDTYRIHTHTHTNNHYNVFISPRTPCRRGLTNVYVLLTKIFHQQSEQSWNYKAFYLGFNDYHRKHWYRYSSSYFAPGYSLHQLPQDNTH